MSLSICQPEEGGQCLQTINVYQPEPYNQIGPQDDNPNNVPNRWEAYIPFQTAGGFSLSGEFKLGWLAQDVNGVISETFYSSYFELGEGDDGTDWNEFEETEFNFCQKSIWDIEFLGNYPYQPLENNGCDNTGPLSLDFNTDTDIREKVLLLYSEASW